METGKNRFFNICEAYSKMLSDRNAGRAVNEHFHGKNMFADGRSTLSNKYATLDGRADRVPSKELASEAAKAILSTINSKTKDELKKFMKYEIVLDGKTIDTSERPLEAGEYPREVSDVIDSLLDNGEHWTYDYDQPWKDGEYVNYGSSDLYEEISDSLGESLEGKIKIKDLRGHNFEVLPGTYEGHGEFDGKIVSIVVSFPKETGLGLGYLDGMPSIYPGETAAEYMKKRGEMPTPNLPESAQRRCAARGGRIDESYDDFDNVDYGDEAGDYSSQWDKYDDMVDEVNAEWEGLGSKTKDTFCERLMYAIGNHIATGRVDKNTMLSIVNDATSYDMSMSDVHEVFSKGIDVGEQVTNGRRATAK